MTQTAPHSPHSSPEPGTDRTESLDLQVLERFRTFMGEQAEEAVAAVLGAFLEGAPPLLARLQGAAAGGDWLALEQAAHSLKSSSAAVGAVALSQQCRHLEWQARQGEAAVAEGLVQAIVAEYGRAEAALRRAFGPGKSPGAS